MTNHVEAVKTFRQAILLSSKLMQKVFAGIRNRCLNSGNFKTGFLSILRAFDSTRKSLLSLSQSLVFAIEMLRVDHLFPITRCYQASNTSVNSNGFGELRQWLNTWTVYQHCKPRYDESSSHYNRVRALYILPTNGFCCKN